MMEERIREALGRLFDEDTADAARLDNLGGHASLRIYWRIHLPPDQGWAREEHTRIAMVLPEDRDIFESDEGTGDAPAPTELPFLDVHRLLSHMDLPVPAVDAAEMDLGVLILEDLGDETFEDLWDEIVEDFGDELSSLRVPAEQLYHRAINLLVDLQRSYKQTQFDHTVEPPESIALERSFDEELLRWELEHYLEWGLEALYGAEAIREVRGDFERLFDELVEELIGARQTLVLRDYQSRNLMQKEGQLVLIDFQDALLGPVVYDLVALLRDSYIELPYLLVRRLVEHYIQQGVAAGLGWCDDAEAVHRLFDLQTIQRKLKDAGRFVFIDREKGNDSFLPYYKPSIGYVRQALEVLPDFAELDELLSEFEPAYHND